MEVRKGCVVNSTHVVFIYFGTQPGTNFPCVPNSLEMEIEKKSPSVIPGRFERVECEHYKGYPERVELGLRVKIEYLYLQRVTTPFNCRIFHQSHSYKPFTSYPLPFPLVSPSPDPPSVCESFVG